MIAAGDSCPADLALLDRVAGMAMADANVAFSTLEDPLESPTGAVLIKFQGISTSKGKPQF